MITRIIDRLGGSACVLMAPARPHPAGSPSSVAASPEDCCGKGRRLLVGPPAFTKLAQAIVDNMRILGGNLNGRDRRFSRNIPPRHSMIRSKVRRLPGTMDGNTGGLDTVV